MKQSVVAVVLLLLFPAAARAQSPDEFNQALLGDGPATVSQTFTRSYDSSAYTFDAQFPTQERDRMGCGVGGGFRFGARTAWHRFEAGGAGSVAVLGVQQLRRDALRVQDDAAARRQGLRHRTC